MVGWGGTGFDGTGRILLTRASGGVRDRFRRYDVLLDGVTVGRISRSQTLTFDVAPGRHVLHLEISWCSSRPTAVDVSPATEYRFACAPGGRADQSLEGVLGDPGGYIALWPTETAEPSRVRNRGEGLQMAFAFGLFIGAFLLIGGSIASGSGSSIGKGFAVVGAAVVVIAIVGFHFVKRAGRRSSRDHDDTRRRRSS